MLKTRNGDIVGTQVFLRISDVCRVTGLPRATIYQMASQGLFPKQVRLSPSAGSNPKFCNGNKPASQSVTRAMEM